jgi:hypothetical protein
MNRTLAGAFIVVAFTAGVGAQEKKMATEKMDHMAMEKTYSGCIESSQAGSYTLAHSMIAGTRESMKKADAMKKGDAMKKHDAMADDAMAPARVLSAAAAGVDLAGHVGHKVTVTGTDGDSMNGMATFTVKSITMLSAKCS